MTEQELREQVATLYRAGLTRPQIDAKLGLPATSADKVIRRIRRADPNGLEKKEPKGPKPGGSPHFTRNAKIIELARTGMSYREIGDAAATSFGTARRVIADYRREHPDELPYRYAATAEARKVGMSASAWSPEREEHILNEWPRGTPWRIVLAAINEMPGPKVEYGAMVMRAAHLKAKRPPGSGGRPTTTVDFIFTQSCRWEDACDAIGLRFDDIPDPDAGPVGLRGIMRGKPPNHDEMVSRHVAQAAQSRLKVTDGFVRGLA